MEGKITIVGGGDWPRGKPAKPAHGWFSARQGARGASSWHRLRTFRVERQLEGRVELATLACLQELGTGLAGFSLGFVVTRADRDLVFQDRPTRLE
jgi:hypothetical protein